MKTRILVVEDEVHLGWAIRGRLERDGYEAEHVTSGEEALERFEKQSYHIVILDYMLPGIDGLKTLEKLKKIAPAVSVIFVTAHGDNDLAWKSIGLGADDYFNKPFNLQNLSFLVFKLLKTRALENELLMLKSERRSSFTSIVHKSAAMADILDTIDKIVVRKTSVLITGETGTGKELIANAIHHNTFNPRKDRPFHAVNCAAIPEPLIESELFGHARGAFTGAVGDKKGIFEAANGGTIFLDEIPSASPALQGKLLRILDTGEFYRVGDTEPRKTSVFIIAATNKDLDLEVAQGRFREDLYHRLKVIQINLPPLRERREDVEPLVNHFLRAYSDEIGRKFRIAPQALEYLKLYDWPGNVRELKNIIHSILVIKTEGKTIGVGDLPERVTGEGTDGLKGDFSDLKSRLVLDFESSYFRNLLLETKGNVSECARKAGIARVYLIRKLKALDIDPKKFR